MIECAGPSGFRTGEDYRDHLPCVFCEPRKIGLYDKFVVLRRDGSSGKGGKHERKPSLRPSSEGRDNEEFTMTESVFNVHVSVDEEAITKAVKDLLRSELTKQLKTLDGPNVPSASSILKVRSLAARYLKNVHVAGVASSRASTGNRAMDYRRTLGHIAWMCDTLLQEENFDDEKLNRWLGFIQGALWSAGLCSIDDLRNDVKGVGL